MIRHGVLFILICFFPLRADRGWSQAPQSGSSGQDVLVVFNSQMPESKEVAQYYALKRKIPATQILGLELPRAETISREEFKQKLQKPILEFLEQSHWISFVTNSHAGTNGSTSFHVKTAQCKFRYLVLVHGVPLTVLSAPDLPDPGSELINVKLRRNNAAVDNELALLPLVHFNLPLAGPVRNPLYSTTNNLLLHPTNGILMVARLDGPTPKLAMGLVDKAIFAETEGLWGRAYFDLRGITDHEYKLGDDWIKAASVYSQKFGLETIVDLNPETFSKAFPMSHIAIYLGWYDQRISGPFTKDEVEFMPGAFAYHLFSYSARSLRDPGGSWVAAFIEKGATITLGCVDEPYLGGTPDVSILTARLMAGFTFGEAAYAAQQSLSWQTTVVGDPLYRPFGTHPRVQHQELIKRRSPYLEWSHLRVVDRNLALNAPTSELIAYLENEPLTRKSAILLEKLADLYEMIGKPNSALYTMRQSLKYRPSPEQQVRLMLKVAEKLEKLGRTQDAFEAYKIFARTNKKYAEMSEIFDAQLSLAAKLNLKTEVQRIEREKAGIKRSQAD